MTQKKSIKEWAADDQPREKMMAKGKKALSNAELLAILLRTGDIGTSAVELSRSILDSVGNDLIALSNLTLDDLMQHKGIGEAKAITIIAALELGKRRRGAEANLPTEVKDSKDSFERFLPYIDDMRQEHFLVLYLNQSNHALKVECLSNGGTTNVIADPKLIFKNALNLGATCLVLGHNHPSGNPRPSEDDRQLTKKLVAAGKLLDITVIDHIIIGNERYYSFRDHGEMTF
jgi:DNA repair protein RadC